MKFIGAHVSATPLVSIAPEEARLLGAKAFAFNLVDPLKWSSPAYSEADIETFRRRCSQYGYTPDQCILPHSAFVVNLGSPDARKLSMSRKTFVDELKRCKALGLTRLNFHPGSHLKQVSLEECLRTVSESINRCLADTDSVTAVIENTAGQGSNVGFTFEQLAEIICHVEDKSRIGVCIDTCHAMASGYDLSDTDNYKKLWDEFDSTVGFSYLKGMHLNDALRQAGSRIDRHSPIGKGTIGIDFFCLLMADKRFDNIPLILETPNPENWAEEISLLYSMTEN